MWINRGINKWIVLTIWTLLTLVNQLLIPENYRLLILIILLLLVVIFFLVDRRVIS